MSAETVYTELVEKFKTDVENATREALDKIHSEMVPYLNDDTESNATYRAVEMVRKIMVGDFEVVGNGIQVDGWTISSMTDFDYDKLVDVLSSKAGDVAKDMKIARLEAQLKSAIEFKYS